MTLHFNTNCKECLTYLCENNEKKADYYITEMIEANSVLQKRITIDAMNKIFLFV